MPVTQNTFGLTQPSKTTPVEHPTWYGDIRYMFTGVDVKHMGSQGLDLTNYDAVVTSSSGIYGQVSTGGMPPQNPWSAAWVQTFLNWMKDNFPKGTNTGPGSATISSIAAAAKATRIRKDIETLSAAEINKLKQAFEGILAKATTDSNSYFVQAGYHWLPAPPHCIHHAPGYSPWHRAYLLSFENALRSVPGCETVTLPYWDITKPFPNVLKSPPFDKYALPMDIGGGFTVGYKTERYSYPDVQNKLEQYNVTDNISRAMTKTSWEEFHGLLGGKPNNTVINAHDGGHTAIGPTMAQPTVAAFDPVFWFFHCNWDRLFWRWQQSMNATTLPGLLTTITDTQNRNIFTIAVLQALSPFTTGPLRLKTVDIVDLVGSLDVDYEHPPAEIAEAKLAQTERSVLLGRSFRANTDRVNVRVVGLNSTKIPGSFIVHLLNDGQIVASSAFFQSAPLDESEQHAMHHEVHADLSFDFELPLDVISKGELSVRVEPVDKSFVGPEFPPKLMGNPKIEVNILLRQE
jgi:tyrosinase